MVELYGIKDLGAFSDEERYHIRTLHSRKKRLMGERDHRASLGKEKKDELLALEWVFNLLDEVSVE